MFVKFINIEWKHWWLKKVEPSIFFSLDIVAVVDVKSVVSAHNSLVGPDCQGDSYRMQESHMAKRTSSISSSGSAQRKLYPGDSGKLDFKES